MEPKGANIVENGARELPIATLEAVRRKTNKRPFGGWMHHDCWSDVYHVWEAMLGSSVIWFRILLVSVSPVIWVPMLIDFGAIVGDFLEPDLASGSEAQVCES